MFVDFFKKFNIELKHMSNIELDEHVFYKNNLNIYLQYTIN